MLYEDLKNDYNNFFNELYNIIGLSRMESYEKIKSNVGWPDKLIELKSFLNRIKLFNMGKRRVDLSSYQYNFNQEFKFLSFIENYIFNSLIKFYSFILKANHRKKRLLKYQWGSSELCLKLEEHFKETNKRFHKKSGINIYKYNYL
jgi:hypothetical protein